MADSELVRYRIEYASQESGSVFFDGKITERDTSEEPRIFEYVDVRLSSNDTLSTAADEEEISKTENAKGHAYINILSPAVAEALRCVVDYFPDLDLSGNIIKIFEPYSVFVFFEKELTEYRDRVAKAAQDKSSTCPNRWAAKHIGIVQAFVKDWTQQAVDAERARHARGCATFDMLWLLYRPGSDVYYDMYNYGEHEPYVVSRVHFNLVNGAADSYNLGLWNIDADSSWVGPFETQTQVERFTGEKRIPCLRAFPCEYLRFSDDIAEEEVSAIRQYYVNRGKRWYGLRQKTQCRQFDGFTTTFPRRDYVSLAMVDPIQFALSQGKERRVLGPGVQHPSGPHKICTCETCQEVIYRHAAKPKFSDYIKVNPLIVESLTDHQYFLCDQMVEAFLFKIRSWQYLHVDGFREPTFDSGLFENLVLKNSTKEFIKNLTQMYIRDSSQPPLHGEKGFNKVTQVHNSPRRRKADATWSADFVEGKGEGLTILLHGRPGVECIADFTERPLLSLTCSDIGVKPENIEANLLSWFKAAENWGAIMLIDEADIYMEQRQVQDIERNHLVAGFLRALEYYKGILFLTTNRVGTFDEAFMSRIHIQIHYPEFEDEERDRLWNAFFQKLEDDRETTMRITQSAKDYVQSQELRALKWNGREIRNAFQVAVALAEAKNQRDKEGRVLVQPDHIRASVQMSTEFRDYLVKVHKGDLSKRASLMGTRYDAFGKGAPGTSKH
ncbi:hypothetical protein NEMBOFW57_000983 [Staphylotrichum longicolle]|uniref:ATPase AAA-type core domain-containing protein n=1 Tax=Staphylotrichum longicolle TaxID=669026 RepID=A0AAD4F0T6_9PEZI|nr:hypothetical protein NEMBOFW57_000983 [Staphylotrichum longicolle]